MVSFCFIIWTASSEFGIRAVSPEPPLLAHTSNESRGTFRQKARCLASLNGWACAVKICHDGMLEDTNSLDGAHFSSCIQLCTFSEDARNVSWLSPAVITTVIALGVVLYMIITCIQERRPISSLLTLNFKLPTLIR